MIDSVLKAIADFLGPTLFYYAFSPAVKIAVLIFVGVLPLISYLVLAERKILGQEFRAGDKERPDGPGAEGDEKVQHSEHAEPSVVQFRGTQPQRTTGATGVDATRKLLFPRTDGF